MTVLCALQRTDECNADYEAQLNCKHEKMRQQLKHLEALQQNIVQLNHQIESNNSKGIDRAGPVGLLRQNANYRSLPLGTKLWSPTDHTGLKHSDQRINAQHCNDMLSTQKFDMLTCEDVAESSVGISTNSSRNPSDGMSVCGESRHTFPSVNSVQWSDAAGMNSHSENLRNTSYRMIGRFALHQADVQQSKQSMDTCLPESVDHNSPLLSLGQSSADVADHFPTKTESVPMRLPLTEDEDPELEQTLQSPQPNLDEVGSVVGHVSRPTDGSSELVLLPDVIGSTGTASTLSESAAPIVSPPVDQKSKFQHPS